MAFDNLVESTECVYGPFASEDDAKHGRSVAQRTRSEATVRSTTAAEPIGRAGER